MNLYNFSAIDIDGNKREMSEFKDKVLLIVNTASKCGLVGQLKGLENLYQKYKDQGFEVLGFPCGQFAGQELESDEEIADFCQLNYGVSFTMFSKIKVNGKDAHPIYKFLKDQESGMVIDAIKWNYTKFLIDRDGNVVDRFSPKTEPKELESHIESLL